MIRKQYVDTTYGQVHVRMAGRPSEYPIVLLHQTASSSVMFERMMGALEDEYWLIAPDTAGFGQSFRPMQQPSVRLYADSLRQTLEAIGVSSCWLFGHHTGASIAVELAADWTRMVRKLCLVGPPLMTRAQIEKFANTLIPFTCDADYVEAIWQRTAGKSADIDPTLLYREALLTLQADVQLCHAYHAVFEHDFASQIGRITCPTLLVAGEQDSLRAALEPTFERLQNGTMQIIPNAGTYICDEQPELMANVLRTFFVEDQ